MIYIKLDLIHTEILFIYTKGQLVQNYTKHKLWGPDSLSIHLDQALLVFTLTFHCSQFFLCLFINFRNGVSQVPFRTSWCSINNLFSIYTKLQLILNDNNQLIPKCIWFTPNNKVTYTKLHLIYIKLDLICTKSY